MHNELVKEEKMNREPTFYVELSENVDEIGYVI